MKLELTAWEVDLIIDSLTEVIDYREELEKVMEAFSKIKKEKILTITMK